jgi:hypothetical protein
MSQHTPGPITKIQGFDSEGYVVWEATGSRVQTYRAAPAMLEALKAVLDCNLTYGSTKAERAFKAVRTAIAQAEGKE